MNAKKKEVPVYLICGFLESGKTSFLRTTLTPDGLADGTNTLLITCEDGEEEYDENSLKELNICHVTVENKEELTREFLNECDSKYKAKQVVFEFNGMWEMEELYSQILPNHWILYQIVLTVDSTTFEAYTANMASLMMEKLRNADMIIFNRCNEERKEMLRKRNIKMLNRQAAIFLEFEDGSTEDYDSGVPPFDMTQPVLDLTDSDYGVWYPDVMEHPDRYEGHTVRFCGMVAKSPKFPKGSLVAGRFAMVCCAKDAQFFGMIVMTPDHAKYKNRDWVYVTARVKVENQQLFEGEGPVLYAEEITPAEPPKEQLITF